MDKLKRREFSERKRWGGGREKRRSRKIVLRRLARAKERKKREKEQFRGDSAPSIPGARYIQLVFQFYLRYRVNRARMKREVIEGVERAGLSLGQESRATQSPTRHMVRDIEKVTKR